jgi:hypothetical protein
MSHPEPPKDEDDLEAHLPTEEEAQAAAQATESEEKIALEGDTQLAETLKGAALLDEEARVLRAEDLHGDDDVIPAGEQISFLWNVTPASVQAYKKRFPFIQISQVIDENDPMPESKLVFKELESGWTVFDYGSAFAASRGEFLFAEGDFRIKLPNEDDEDGGDGDNDGIANPGKGTWINQAVMTAEELARMAVVREWAAAEIFDADPLMAFAFWAEASYYGLAVFGYEPTAADIAKRNRMKLSRRDLEEAIQAKRNIAQLTLE